MEENQNSVLFGLNIEHSSKADFLQAAKWGRIAGICGIAFFGLLLLMMLMSGTDKASLIQNPNEFNADKTYMTAYWLGGIFFYIILSSVLLFLPSFFILRFSSSILAALKTDDQVSLNAGIKRMKICFRYIGILMLLFLVLFAIVAFLQLVKTGIGR